MSALEDGLAGGLAYMAGAVARQRYEQRRADGLPKDTGDLAVEAGRRAFLWVMSGILLFVGLIVAVGLLMAVGHTVDWDWTCANGQSMHDGVCY